MFSNEAETAGGQREETRSRSGCDGRINNQTMQRETRFELILIEMSSA